MGVKIRKRKGAWWVFVDYRGKRKARRVGPSKKMAQTVASKIQLRLDDVGSAALESWSQVETVITFETYARLAHVLRLRPSASRTQRASIG